MLTLRSETGEIRECDFRETARWPDGSVKWVLLEFFLPPGNRETETCKLVVGALEPAARIQKNNSSLSVENTNASLRVGEEKLLVDFDKAGTSVFPSVEHEGKNIWRAENIRLRLAVPGAGEYTFVKNKFAIEKEGRQSVKCSVAGGFVDEEGRQVLNARLQFSLSPGGLLSVHCEIHNPARAMHKNGLWDLGDSGSVSIDDFSLLVSEEIETLQIRSNRDSVPQTVSVSETMSVFQASSGGDHWESPVHINAAGQTVNPFRGFRVMEGQRIVEEGNRAQPVVCVSNTSGASYLVTVADFWQNFPTSIETIDGHLAIGLFPSCFGSAFELQGGEKKGHEVVFAFNGESSALESSALDWVQHRASVSVEPAAFYAAGVFRYSSREYSCPRYDKLLETGLSDASGFIAKREVVDEYGWRNFGDIYADHETLFHEKPEIFVSHYNNQYDPIYGFARQYCLTGDRRWYELMTSLAQHVLDIDIYHTAADRAEYNHGMFWHTDHYKNAASCTHRTYSKEHYAGDWSGEKGGGPGPEHCYTTGLCYYYFLTGDKDAAFAVEGLADWITCSYEGTGSVLEQLKTTLQTDLKQFVALMRGRKVFRYRYPLSRGTGNYIRALLDSHAITNDPVTLSRVEKIIADTFGPADDISLRNLLDAEYTWFYIIFLQEVVRFLDVKREHGEFDQGFSYARNGLLHYVRWMTENESAYLSKPDQLIYPNDTWVAQEVRKVDVFYAAYRYSTGDRGMFLERARYFRDYLLEALAKSDTRHFCRIQVILLQNHGPSGYVESECAPYAGLTDIDTPDHCFFTPQSFLAGILKRWGRCLLRFSPKREIRWVKARVR